MTQTLTMNANRQTLKLAMAPGLLLTVLRNDLEPNGLKSDCDLGECGACSVLIDGIAARSCMLPTSAMVVREIFTLERLAIGGRLTPVQRLVLWGQTANPETLTHGHMVFTGLPAEYIKLYQAPPAQTSHLGRHYGDDTAADAALWGDDSAQQNVLGKILVEATVPPRKMSANSIPTSLPIQVHGADLSLGVAVIANPLFDTTGVRFRQPPFTASRVRQALQNQASPLHDMNPAQHPKHHWLKAAALTAVVSTAVIAWPWKGAFAPINRPSANLFSAETIERGRHLAAAGGCIACLTANGGPENAGGHAFETPLGTIYSTNLTPDKATGIGQWSYAAFERTMRHGISRDGRHLYTAFPYTAFAKISDADMQALHAYLMAQPAVKSEAPANALSFPFNVRALLAGWNTLYLKRNLKNQKRRLLPLSTSRPKRQPNSVSLNKSSRCHLPSAY